MAVLVGAHELKKSFAARPLFEALTFSIESGERIGLIGPNGAGKSTLLRILASLTEPDDGTLSFQRGLRVGYLEQTPVFKKGEKVFEAVLSGTPDPDDWESMALAHEFLSKLSLDGTQGVGEETPIDVLSGGWRKRVALARELVKKPDLLLLDEPTNHLDVESIIWLEEYIRAASFATVTITHDRLFLQRIANRILELDRRNPGGLLSVKGEYADYVQLKDDMLSAQEKRETTLKNTLRRETEWLRRGAKARTTKQQARIERAGDLKAEVEELGYRNQNRVARLDFQSSERNPKKLLEAKKISKSFGDQSIFEDVSLLMTPGSRIGLLGPNGCGKSTLIRTLLGKEAATHGEVFRSPHLKVAYFEQNREALDPTKTVMKTLCPTGDHVSYRDGQIHIRSYLDRFLFGQGQMEMAVGKLSGGEQSRLLIAKLMLQEANLLVLDEPTNDLDLATLNVLEECLTDFNGSILLVTHDRYFLDQVTTQILAFPVQKTKHQKIMSFVGLEQWERWHKEQTRLIASGGIPEKAQTPSAANAKKKKLTYKDQRDWDMMDSNIASAEAKLRSLQEESAKPEYASNSVELGKLTRQMSEAQEEIDILYARWSELEKMH